MPLCDYVGPDNVPCKLEAEKGSNRCYWHQNVIKLNHYTAQKSQMEYDQQVPKLKPVLIFWSLMSLAYLLKTAFLMHKIGLRVDLLIYVFLELLALGVYYSIYTGRLRFDSIRTLVIVSVICGVAASFFRILELILYPFVGSKISKAISSSLIVEDVVRLIVYLFLVIILVRSLK